MKICEEKKILYFLGKVKIMYFVLNAATISLVINGHNITTTLVNTSFYILIQCLLAFYDKPDLLCHMPLPHTGAYSIII